MKHKKQSKTLSLVYMLLKYNVLPSDFAYAAKLYHARKLMYSINVFQKKEDEVNVIDDVFFIFAKIAYKNFTNFMNFNGKRFYM